MNNTKTLEGCVMDFLVFKLSLENGLESLFSFMAKSEEELQKKFSKNFKINETAGIIKDGAPFQIWTLSENDLFKRYANFQEFVEISGLRVAIFGPKGVGKMYFNDFINSCQFPLLGMKHDEECIVQKIFNYYHLFSKRFKWLGCAIEKSGKIELDRTSKDKYSNFLEKVKFFK